MQYLRDGCCVVLARSPLGMDTLIPYPPGVWAAESLPRNSSDPQESSHPRFMSLPGDSWIWWQFQEGSRGLAPGLNSRDSVGPQLLGGLLPRPQLYQSLASPSTSPASSLPHIYDSWEQAHPQNPHLKVLPGACSFQDPAGHAMCIAFRIQLHLIDVTGQDRSD